MREILFATTAIAALTFGAAVHAQQQGQGGQQGQGTVRQLEQSVQELQQTLGQGNQVLTQEQAAQQGAQLYVSPADVRNIKQALNDQNYDAGTVDGNWNQAAQQALRNWQQAQGLEPTGQLNPQSLSQLGIGTGQGGGQGGQQQGQGGQQGGDQVLAQETARGSGAPLYVSPATVRMIQQALNQAGYEAGEVDGQWGQKTQAAMKNWQQAQGLEPTGNVNGQSLQALGVSFGGQGQGGDQQLAQETSAGQGTELYVAPSTVRQIEQALNQQGYDAGDVDGQWNQEAQQALRNFEQAQGLEPTGNINTQVLAALGVDTPIMQLMGGGGGQVQGGGTATGQTGTAAAGGGQQQQQGGQSGQGGGTNQ